MRSSFSLERHVLKLALACLWAPERRGRGLHQSVYDKLISMTKLVPNHVHRRWLHIHLTITYTSGQRFVFNLPPIANIGVIHKWNTKHTHTLILIYILLLILDIVLILRLGKPHHARVTKNTSVLRKEEACTGLVLWPDKCAVGFFTVWLFFSSFLCCDQKHNTGEQRASDCLREQERKPCSPKSLFRERHGVCRERTHAYAYIHIPERKVITQSDTE